MLCGATVGSQLELSTEHVGDNCAGEARKSHDKEKKARGIFGNATPDQASELVEEGIEVHPLPILPEDGN